MASGEELRRDYGGAPFFHLPPMKRAKDAVERRSFRRSELGATISRYWCPQIDRQPPARTVSPYQRRDDLMRTGVAEFLWIASGQSCATRNPRPRRTDVEGVERVKADETYARIMALSFYAPEMLENLKAAVRADNDKYKPVTPRETLIKISVARCARVSYTSFETGRRSTLEEDLALYDRLVGAQPLHASPAEHQATPDDQELQVIEHENPWMDAADVNDITLGAS